jgi:Flp pilus assembly protein TadG
MMIAWKKFCRTLSAFRSARGGNVAVIFAFSTLPLLAFVGAAIDYSRANSVKAAMQTALDSTALMLSKEAASDTADQLKADALKYFTAVFTKSEAKDITINVTYGTDGGSNILLNATASLPADFAKFVGMDSFTVKATSTAKWGITRLRVALVLDNTGSMADAGKIDALKSATKTLLSQLQGAVTTPGDVYVSIIPFVKDVNLGPANFSADWIYWGTAPVDNNANNPAAPIQDATSSDNASWNANHGKCYDITGALHSGQGTRSQCFANVGTCNLSGYTTQSSCTGAGTCSLSGYTTSSTCLNAGSCSISGKTSQTSCTSAGTCSISGITSKNTCTSSGVCSLSQWTSQSKCTKNGGTWTAGIWTSGTWTSTPGTWTAGVWTPGIWTPNNHNTWNGCVMDRGNPGGPDTTYNFDTTAAAPDPVTPRWSSLYAAEQYQWCPQAVKSLSYDWPAMNSLVDNMSPAGNTNQGLGLQLGWMSLIGSPFTVPPEDPTYKYSHVIILLTDGLNTQNRWSSNQSTIDARQQMTCDNFKAADPSNVLYTIQVNTGGDPTSTLLQNCASDPSKFYLLTSASQMTATFQTIGTNLTKLRLAQ